MLRISVVIVVLLSQAFLLTNRTKVLGAYISWSQEHQVGPAKEAPGVFQPEEEEGDYFEGDIILGPYKVLHGDVKNLVADRNLLWPERTLYYQFSNEFNEDDKYRIRTAIADLQSVTCVRFVEGPGAGAYMLVRNLNGCAAPVGYYGIRTDMFLSAIGCRSWGTIQHEFLHALGFWHEHTRPDRDNHVQIVWQNIRPGRTDNFLARSPAESQYLGMPYDYGSVMHYRAAAFSRDGSPTIVPLQPGAQIGQRVRYSMTDLAKLNRLYECGPGYYVGKGLYEGAEELEESGEKEEEEEEEEEVNEEWEKTTEAKEGEKERVTEEGGEVEGEGKTREKEGETKRGEEVKDSISQEKNREKMEKNSVGGEMKSGMGNHGKD